MNALCFDFDGTLAHYTGDFEGLLASLRMDLGLTQCDMNTFATLLSQELRRDGPVALRTALMSVLEQLEQALPAGLDHVCTTALEAYAHQVALLPGAAAVLELTRSVPRALITNGPSDMQRAALEKVDLEAAFDTIVVSGDTDVGARKPDPRIFDTACARLGVTPADALMIGDNLEADIRGALAYGMRAVWLGDEHVEVDRVTDTQALYTYLKERLVGAS